ncbi:MAG: ferritin [Candidatus Izemoplasmatales bacterium]|nr:ferritin [Candidatus Izemoplasmatales bacterium]MDD4069873.1 ferritin [Candidatus Izemoplasmatales bacterium]MDY0138181.1 ferritin [Candidatus Izemoplasmatales bacterium]
MDKKFVEAINTQLNFEIESAHVYLAMQNYFANKSLKGFEHWFQIQFREELEHAQKFMDYLNDRGERVEIRGFENPRNDFESILEILEVSLNHEKEVTRRINNLMKMAIDLNDYASISFLQWYVDEQVEEEANFSELIDKVEMLGNTGIFMLDRELGKRED